MVAITKIYDTVSCVYMARSSCKLQCLKFLRCCSTTWRRYCLYISSFVQALKSLIKAKPRSAQSFTHAILLTTEFASWYDESSGHCETGNARKLSSSLSTSKIVLEICGSVMLHASVVRRCDPRSVVMAATSCFFQWSPSLSIELELPFHDKDTRNVFSSFWYQHSLVVIKCFESTEQLQVIERRIDGRPAAKPWPYLDEYNKSIESLQSLELPTKQQHSCLISIQR